MVSYQSLNNASDILRIVNFYPDIQRLHPETRP